MKAAVLYELNQPVVVDDIDMEGPKKGEVLVKVAATGVCHSLLPCGHRQNPLSASGGVGR